MKIALTVGHFVKLRVPKKTKVLLLISDCRQTDRQLESGVVRQEALTSYYVNNA